VLHAAKVRLIQNLWTRFFRSTRFTASAFASLFSECRTSRRSRKVLKNAMPSESLAEGSKAQFPVASVTQGKFPEGELGSQL
jgi:hypothetical protein